MVHLNRTLILYLNIIPALAFSTSTIACKHYILMNSYILQLALEQINERSLDDFCNTKGIGPSRGKTIIEHRMKHGPFLSLVDLAAIKGFGRTFFKNLLESDGVLPIQQKKHKLSNLLTSEQKKV